MGLKWRGGGSAVAAPVGRTRACALNPIIILKARAAAVLSCWLMEI